jgi:hypothetical protein
MGQSSKENLLRVAEDGHSRAEDRISRAEDRISRAEDGIGKLTREQKAETGRNER